MPHAVITTVTKSLGTGASTMALFTFGLSLSNIKLSKEIWSKDLLLTVLTKNLLHPIAAFIIGYYLFHLDYYWLASLIITASAPTAFIIYIIAKQFSIDQNTVKLTVASSSFASLISLVFITWAL